MSVTFGYSLNFPMSVWSWNLPRSHNSPQEPRSSQGGATGRTSRKDGSTSQQEVLEPVWGESPLLAIGRELDLAKSAEEQQLVVFKRADYQCGSGVTVLAAQAWDQIKAKDPEAVVSREEFEAGLHRKVAKRLGVTRPQLLMMIFKGRLKWGDLYR